MSGDVIGGRVLTAQKRYGPWREFDPDTGYEIDRDGEFWTVIDRDTGQLIGSFGLMVQVATREEALNEAERFGSKWGWPCDREAAEDVFVTALAGFIAYDRGSRRVCATWRGSVDAGDLHEAWLRWVSAHLDHGCAISNVLSTEAFPAAGESWLPEVLL